MCYKIGDLVIVTGDPDEMYRTHSTSGYKYGEEFVVKSDYSGDNGVQSGKRGANWIYSQYLLLINDENMEEVNKIRELAEDYNANKERIKEDNRKREEAERIKAEEAIRKAELRPLRDRLRKRMADGRSPGVCTFAYRVLGQASYIYERAPCHASLGNKNDIVEAILHVANHMPNTKLANGKGAEKNYYRWLDYILNRSPWSVAFVTKSVWEAMYEGIVLNVHVCHDVMVTAAIAVRTGSEFTNTSMVFCEALDNGATEPQAAFVSCFYRKGGFWDHMGGHHVIRSNLNFKQIVRFFETGYDIKLIDNKLPSNKNRGTTSYSVSANLATERRKTVHEVIHGFMVTVGTGWEAKVVPLTIKDFVIALQKEWK